MGSAVKVKVGEMEDKKRQGRIRRTMKDVMVCLQAVVVNKKLLVQF